MSKIIILKDNTLSQTDELLTLIKSDMDVEIIEVQDPVDSSLEEFAQKNKTILIALGKLCELGPRSI